MPAMPSRSRAPSDAAAGWPAGQPGGREGRGVRGSGTGRDGRRRPVEPRSGAGWPRRPELGARGRKKKRRLRGDVEGGERKESLEKV